MKSHNDNPKRSINRVLFHQIAVEARITEKAANVMYDRFIEHLREGYLNSEDIVIPNFGVITSTPPEESMGWHIIKQRVDYIVRLKRPRLRIYERLKNEKKCKARR